MICPYCNSVEVQRVFRRDVFDVLLSWMGKWPHACEQCRSRFFLKLERAVQRPAPRSWRTSAAPRPAARQAPAVEIVEYMEVGGAWELARSRECRFPEAEYICPRDLAGRLVSLLEEPPERAESPASRARRRVRRRGTATAGPGPPKDTSGLTVRA